MFGIELVRNVHFTAGKVPNDLIPERVLAKNFVHDALNIVNLLPVEVDVDGSIVRKKIS